MQCWWWLGDGKRMLKGGEVSEKAWKGDGRKQAGAVEGCTVKEKGVSDQQGISNGRHLTKFLVSSKVGSVSSTGRSLDPLVRI